MRSPESFVSTCFPAAFSAGSSIPLRPSTPSIRASSFLSPSSLPATCVCALLICLAYACRMSVCAGGAVFGLYGGMAGYVARCVLFPSHILAPSLSLASFFLTLSFSAEKAARCGPAETIFHGHPKRGLPTTSFLKSDPPRRVPRSTRRTARQWRVGVAFCVSRVPSSVSVDCEDSRLFRTPLFRFCWASVRLLSFFAPAC